MRRTAALLFCLTVAGCGNPLVDKAKDVVREELRDPDSAEFRNVKVGGASGLEKVCGVVIAKYSFGVYGVYRRVLVEFIGDKPYPYVDSSVGDFVEIMWKDSPCGS